MVTYFRAGRMSGPRPSAIVAVVCLATNIVAGLSLAERVEARSLASTFRNELQGLKLDALAPALARSVASTYPVASASSSVTFRFDPELQSFERSVGVLGPLIGERAETIGAEQVNVSLNYSYVGFDSFNGQSLDHLQNRSLVNGKFVFLPTGRPVTLADGRTTTLLPVRVNASLDVEAQILTPGITYGLTKDLDFNVTLPLIRTYLNVTHRDELPDPRFSEFEVAPSGGVAPVSTGTASNSSVGVGDLLLRAKYSIVRSTLADVSALLGLSVPTGSTNDLQGTGDTLVEPVFIASKVLDGWFEPFVNVGFGLNANDVSLSDFRWAVGAVADVTHGTNLAVTFLGRNEFSRQVDSIEDPFFLQINRNDYYDVSMGIRWILLESLTFSGNVILPLNDDGFRADVIPTLDIQYVFSAN